MTPEISDEVQGRLRAIKTAAFDRKLILEMIDARDQVLSRYSPSFQPGAIADLEEEVLRSFLYFENNCHWTGLNRQVNRICADMPRTRLALADLVDEQQAIETRMAKSLEIVGMGKAIITAILHVAYPNKYGVWNTTSDVALVELGLMPELGRGASFGERYAAINGVLLKLAECLEVDLWTLDGLWWAIEMPDDEVEAVEDGIVAYERGAIPQPGRRTFLLERHLQDYLFDNWGTSGLAGDWVLFTRDGEPDAGYEFPTVIGRIDLLARHIREPRWLVIELKRHSSSDQAVGQVLRYIGWIRAHVAEPGDTVEGLIIAGAGDAKLHYAVSAVPDLTFMAYEVEFKLTPGLALAELAKR
jgi:hypothetical protein